MFHTRGITPFLVCVPAVVAVVSFCGAGSAAAQDTGPPTRIESEPFIVQHHPGTWAKDSIRISPDGKRFGVVIQVGDKARASIDGRDGKTYGWARDIACSGDSRRVGYVATTGGQDLIVIDGREETFRGEIWGGTRGGGGTLRLNLDGTRVAFVARKGNAPAFGVFVNGVMEQATVDPNDGAPVFSPDGKRLASIAQDGAQRFVVLDGRPAPSFYEALWNITGGRVVFDTPTSFSYSGQKDGRIYLVREALLAR